MSILEDLISADFTLKGNNRWYSTLEHSSLIYDKEKDIFFWNSAGISGTAFTWLVKVKGYSFDQAKNYLKQFPQYSDSFILNIRNGEEAVTYPAIVDILYERGQQTDNNYWKRRGLTDETISRFRLGYLDTQDGFGFWTIPIYEGGLFRQVQLRRDIPAKMIRKYYRNTLEPSYLFNSDILNITSSVIITESPVSAMRVSQEGGVAVSHDGGSGYWGDSWYSKFMFQKRITICYDNDLGDKAGLKGAIKVAKKLGEFKCKIYTFDEFEDHFGIDNYLNEGHNLTDLKELLDEKAKYWFELPSIERKHN
jgi:hypothetical protein